MQITLKRLMASAALVVVMGYAVRLIGMALFDVSFSGSMTLFGVNILMFVGMVTFVIASSTYIVRMGVKAAR